MIPSHSQFQSPDPEPPSAMDYRAVPSRTYGGKEPEDFGPSDPMPPRNMKVEANLSAEGRAHSDLLDSRFAHEDALPRPYNQDDRWQNDKDRKELDARLKHAEDANKEEVDSANLVAKGTSIESLMRNAAAGKYMPMSADAMNRARQGSAPQLRKEI